MVNNLLSIIIPVYNAEEQIVKCIESIQQQTYRDLEIIIIDDGSTDDTYRICFNLKRTYRNIKLFRQNNQGPGQARKKGFQHAHGEFVTFIDADDYVDKNAYNGIIELFKKGNFDIVQFGYRHVAPNGAIIQEHVLKNMRFDNNYDAFLYFLTQDNCTNYLWNKVYKYDLLCNINWLNLYYSEDYALLAQLYSKARSVITIEECFYNYVQFPNSACNKPFNEKKLDQINAGQFVVEYTKRVLPEMLPFAYFWLATHSARLSEEVYLSDRKDRAELIHFLRLVFRDSYKNMVMSGRKYNIYVKVDKTTRIFAFSFKLALKIKVLLKNK